MTTWVIRHAATTVMLQQTTDPDLPVPAGADRVQVPDDFAIGPPPPGKSGDGWWKVAAGGAKTKASQAEHDAALTSDTTENQGLRATLAELKQKGQALHQSTASADLKAFLVALNGFVDSLAGRFQPKIAGN